jgi:hypothetical protein
MWLRGGVYDEWARFVQRWSTGDSTGMADLPSIEAAELSADTLDRLTRRIVDALSVRLQSTVDVLTASLAGASDEFSFGRALTQTRTGLQNVRGLAQHPGLPEQLRTRLVEIVDGQVASFQQSLEEQLARGTSVNDRDIVESRRRALRNNPLTAVSTDLVGPTIAAQDEWYVEPGHRPRRRVVPD